MQLAGAWQVRQRLIHRRVIKYVPFLKFLRWPHLEEYGTE